MTDTGDGMVAVLAAALRCPHDHHSSQGNVANCRAWRDGEAALVAAALREAGYVHRDEVER